MKRTQGTPLESFAPKIHHVFDLFDLLSQHGELCLSQAVHHRVVAVDNFFQIINIPRYNVEKVKGLFL